MTGRKDPPARLFVLWDRRFGEVDQVEQERESIASIREDEEIVEYEAAIAKEHCPLRLAGIPQPRHMPCDTGDFSKDGEK